MQCLLELREGLAASDEHPLRRGAGRETTPRVVGGGWRAELADQIFACRTG